MAFVAVRQTPGAELTADALVDVRAANGWPPPSTRATSGSSTTIPLTSVGKVDRKRLRALVAAPTT